MISNREIDKPWFAMLYAEGFTCDEIAAKDCVWMSGVDIADLIEIEYKEDVMPLPFMGMMC